MNKCLIIGNLTRDPELRQTGDGISVCNFTVAVNKRVAKGGHPEADYFRVAAWRELGENCGKYLAKGKKAAVLGAVSVKTYTDSQGTVRAQLELAADTVEFLTPKGQGEAAQDSDGFIQVDDEEAMF